VRLPKGTTDRLKPFLDPGELPASFWRQSMLTWLDLAETATARAEPREGGQS